MSLTEQERSKLFQDLEQAIGSESAGNLMSHLPPIGWADLATTRDIDALRSELRGELADFRGEIRGELAKLRGEMAELRGQFGGVTGSIGELRGEFHKELNAQTKTLFVSLTSVILSVAALVFAALQLT